jgi:electron transfer flavoprotein alpha/beta subunit
VIGTGKGLNTPRYPTFMDIRNSKKKEIRQIDMDDLGIEAPPSSMEVLELEPSVEQRQPKEIKGTPLEMVRQLIEVLRQEAKVI